jgi:thioesterase domain-containing protein
MRYPCSPESSLPLPIALIRSTEPMEESPPAASLGEDLGWGRFASQSVPVHYVPGNHVSIMQPPHLAILARSLRDAMDSLPDGIAGAKQVRPVRPG